MRGRNSQMMRVFKIITLLETHRYGLSASELTAKLEERGLTVTKRTVYRDLEALCASGFPLLEKGKTDDQGTKWVLETHTQVVQQLTLTLGELWSLYFAKNALGYIEKTPFFDNLQAAFEKIEEKLGSKAQAYLAEVESEIKFEDGPKMESVMSPDLAETVKAGCGERQVLLIKYQSANSQTTRERKVGPHFIYFSKGGFYLVARDLEVGVDKTFSLARMLSAKLLDEVFSQEQVDPSEYFAHSFGVFRGEGVEKISLEIGPKIAPFIRERAWHKSQKVTDREDGKILLELDVAITPELVQWVLSYSGECVVLGPSKLKNEVLRLSKGVVELYEDAA